VSCWSLWWTLLTRWWIAIPLVLVGIAAVSDSRWAQITAVAVAGLLLAFVAWLHWVVKDE
jgi:hypothetical protein